MEPAAQPLILVVEDEPPIADLLCEVFSEHSYRCLTANTADAALRLLERVSPALITLDLGLPGVRGHILLQLLRANAHTRNIPVVIVSAERVIEANVHAACQAVITKPFDLDDLVVTVREVLGANSAGEQTRELGGTTAGRTTWPAARE